MSINIAIDGFSSCGKSSTSKKVAELLNYKYIDTGAMYRAVTYYLQEHQIDWNDEVALVKALGAININFERNEALELITLLNGENVEEVIRTMKVSNSVSEVSRISLVRSKLVEQQKNIAKDRGVVMDGRDIGTVVMPDAELKVFMTADIKIRTERRWQELQAKGIDLSIEKVKENLDHRDLIDSSRADSPLSQAEDALLLDTSNITLQQQIDWIFEKAMEKMV